ncbi:MAG: Nif3-like dinuclear metal center hexameric protein [Bacteroidia bacterium]|nr:Nif3-like dinuclear metal center hexameric protein [Bacteroidia bacterium]
MKLSEIINAIEEVAPRSYQESYDNAGLIIGDADVEVSKAMLCLDVTEVVVDEAVAENCNLIIAHHPLIFGGLKKISKSTDTGRSIIKAIQNNIAVYAAHTNLDNVLENGVSSKIASKLGLINTRILDPKRGLLYKLVTYCPVDSEENILKKLFEAGAGNIGNYSNCSFSSDGTGRFTPNENTNPAVGEKNVAHAGPEKRIEVLVPDYLKERVLSELRKAHPYEEVAYELYKLDNLHLQVGSGIIGDLEKPYSKQEFLEHLKKCMHLDVFKITKWEGETVSKVAVCGGSGSFLLDKAISAGVDVYISADFKYHEYFAAGNSLMVCDIGHYESEIFTLEIFYDIITKKFANFAVVFAKTNTNPITYFK